MFPMPRGVLFPRYLFWCHEMQLINFTCILIWDLFRGSLCARNFNICLSSLWGLCGGGVGGRGGRGSRGELAAGSQILAGAWVARVEGIQQAFGDPDRQWHHQVHFAGALGKRGALGLGDWTSRVPWHFLPSLIVAREKKRSLRPVWEPERGFLLLLNCYLASRRTQISWPIPGGRTLNGLLDGSGSTRQTLGWAWASAQSCCPPANGTLNCASISA